MHGNMLKDLHIRHIMPQHLQLAIWVNNELDTLVQAMIAGGGVFIHP
jgi:hypothetical protein